MIMFLFKTGKFDKKLHSFNSYRNRLKFTYERETDN